VVGVEVNRTNLTFKKITGFSWVQILPLALLFWGYRYLQKCNPPLLKPSARAHP
jgi:hypothetical protein